MAPPVHLKHDTLLPSLCFNMHVLYVAQMQTSGGLYCFLLMASESLSQVGAGRECVLFDLGWGTRQPSRCSRGFAIMLASLTSLRTSARAVAENVRLLNKY